MQAGIFKAELKCHKMESGGLNPEPQISTIADSPADSCLTQKVQRMW